MKKDIDNTIYLDGKRYLVDEVEDDVVFTNISDPYDQLHI